MLSQGRVWNSFPVYVLYLIWRTAETIQTAEEVCIPSGNKWSHQAVTKLSYPPLADNSRSTLTTFSFNNLILEFPLYCSGDCSYNSQWLWVVFFVVFCCCLFVFLGGVVVPSLFLNHITIFTWRHCLKDSSLFPYVLYLTSVIIVFLLPVREGKELH